MKALLAFFRPAGLAVCSLALLFAAAPPPGTVSTFAGSGQQGFGGDNGLAITASLNRPEGVAFDNDGNLLIADSANDRVRRVSATGVITTIAGNGLGGSSGDGGQATAARLNGPTGLVVDRAGNLYISDSGNNRVRRVSTTGIITTIAGTGTAGYSGDGGPANEARLNFPLGLAIDAAGNLFIADYSNNRVRRVAPDGTITTAVGNGVGAFSGDGGPATSASIWWPSGLAFDSAGNLYMALLNNRRIRRVSTSGIITTLAGSDSGTSTGDGGPAVRASIGWPYGIVVDATGNIYFSDTLHSTVRMISTDGNIYPVAGNGFDGYSGDGGAALNASFNTTRDVALDRAGNLYIVDKVNNKVRKVTFPGSNNPGSVTPGTPPVTTPGCTYTLSSNSQAFSSDGGVSAIAVNAATGCAWNAVSNANWITLTSVAAGSGNGSVNFRADANTGPARSGTITIAGLAFNVTQNGTGAQANTPSLFTSGGVLNGASFQDGLTSGAWITVRGANLSTTTRSWGGADFNGNALPTSLDGVQVKVNGIPAYVYFISPGQVNVLSPADATVGPVTVQVVNQLGTSNAVTVNKRAVAPAMFVYSQQNGRYAIAQDAVSYSLVAPAALLGAAVSTRPAVPRQLVSFFATGLGATNPAYSPGEIVPGPATLASPFRVTIGGRPATVQFAGLVGSGLYQVNVEVPDLPTGDAAVVMEVNGVASPANVFLPVQGATVTPPVTTGTYTISTLIGTGVEGYSGDGGPANRAQLRGPWEMAFDRSGSLYLSDTGSSTVRKISPDGRISTVAGTGFAGNSGDGGLATQAQIFGPTGIAVDRAGNLYICDPLLARIRKVSPDGRISTFAGTGVRGFSGDGGPAVNAQLYAFNIAVDAADNVYIADTGNHVIRRVTPNGIIQTIIGTGVQGDSGMGGPASNAQINAPSALALDSAGNLYFLSVGSRKVYKVDTNGVITNFAGTGVQGNSGDGGPAISARFASVSGLAVDTVGNVFIVDGDAGVVRRIDRTGTITRIAGAGGIGRGGDGGPATEAQFNRPTGVLVDSQGFLAIADTNNFVVRLLTPR